MTNPIEPSAAFRELALTFMQMCIAMIAVGFTEGQAMAILGYAIQSATSNGSPL